MEMAATDNASRKEAGFARKLLQGKLTDAMKCVEMEEA
jgi:hypothetical protein